MDNKTGKYFKYAIGEIILVVIGILIALQINNWNEQRKVDGEILKTLNEIRSNLISDSLSIHETRILKSEDINIQYKVIHELESRNIPYDSIEYHLGRGNVSETNLSCRQWLSIDEEIRIGAVKESRTQK